MLLKRLFVFLVIFGFLGTPWAQALVHSQIHTCHSSSSKNLDTGSRTITAGQVFEIAPDKAPGTDTVSLSCARACVALSSVLISSEAISYGIIKRYFESAESYGLKGLTLDPEIFPPIELA